LHFRCNNSRLKEIHLAYTDMDFLALGKIIKEKKQMLNGIDTDGRPASSLKGLRFLRYYLILYYATVSPVFMRDEFMDNDGRGFGLYALAKVAKSLDLDYDRTRTALEVFEDGRKRGEIDMIIANNRHRYFLLTKKGKDICRDALKEIENLRLGSLSYITNIEDTPLIRFLKGFD